MTKRIAVIGGGISGVCTACELAKDPRLSVDVIERAPRLGGLHRSVCLDGFAFDVGYFIFNDKHDIFHSFPFLKDHFTQVQLRQRTITPRGSVDTYPLTIKTYGQDHGWLGVLYAGLDLAICRLLYHRRKSVPAYAKYHMGRAVYRNSGIQNYLERLYGISDQDVGIEFALQRLSYIKNYPIHRMVFQALKGERSPTEHAECTYVRPMAGFDAAYAPIQQYLECLGTTVYLNTKVRRVARSEGGFTVSFDSEVRSYDRVVSTIPIPSMLGLMGANAEVRLETMNLVSLFYKGIPCCDWTTLFNFTLSGSWKRITNHSALYRLDGESYLVVEITTRHTSESQIEQLKEEFERHVSDHHVFHKPPRYLGKAVTEHAYPVFRHGDTERVQGERARLAYLGIDGVGRQGNFEYLSSSTAAARARRLAKEIRQSMRG
ncbi:MAG: FAD-dependent oxidoreductase [Gemmatimonadaceae bacterium]|nr:FAD-dependent oxidoreductase [Gemmatimonadaceae bacterium]